MYLTAPRGKDVSLVCRVTADPTGQVEWFFRGRRIAQDFQVIKKGPPNSEEEEEEEEEEAALPARDRNGERVSSFFRRYYNIVVVKLLVSLPFTAFAALLSAKGH